MIPWGGKGGYLRTPDEALAPSALRPDTLHVVFGLAAPMDPSHRMLCAAVWLKKPKKINMEKITDSYSHITSGSKELFMSKQCFRWVVRTWKISLSLLVK